MMWTAASFSDNRREKGGKCTLNHFSKLSIFYLCDRALLKRTSGRPFMKGVSQLPDDSDAQAVCMGVYLCMWLHGGMCVWIDDNDDYALPQALWVSTEVSELGEYFLLPSERSLSEWQMEGLHKRNTDCEESFLFWWINVRSFLHIYHCTGMWQLFLIVSCEMDRLTQKLSCWIFATERN